MPERPTHRVARQPNISGRYLADFMAASERAKRTILRGCKYRPIAKIVQHNLARRAVTDFLTSGASDIQVLRAEAKRLRAMMADTDFDRQVLDNNADYIDAYAQAYDPCQMPVVMPTSWREDFRVDLNGVQVNPEVRFALSRVTRTNRARTGFVTFRYAKDSPLAEDVALWQSSLLLGCRKLADAGRDDGAEAEGKLCITLDAFTGKAYAAPTDAVSRFLNMKAACATIAEQWPGIIPPEGAVT